MYSLGTSVGVRMNCRDATEVMVSIKAKAATAIGSTVLVGFRSFRQAYFYPSFSSTPSRSPLLCGGHSFERQAGFSPLVLEI